MSTKRTHLPGANRPANKTITHTPARGPDAANVVFVILFAVTLCLVSLALLALGEERGPVASIKYLLVGFAAAGATYGVNRFAVERLAGLHAVGFQLAGIIAISAILITGSGTAISTFTGIVIKSVEAKTYQQVGQALSGFIADANQVALTVARVAPAIEAISEDIAQTASCEVASSCLSGHGSGGRGPMSRALDGASAKAFTIAQAMQAGELARSQQLEELNRLNADFLAVLSDERKSVSERRANLQEIHAEIRQAAAALIEAMPMGLVQSYVAELRSGASISGDPAGSRTLSAYLRGNGDALAKQIDALPDVELVAPAFPDRPGMIDALRFIPTYLAIAAIVIVGELILPLTLYLTTFLRLSWELEKLQGGRDETQKEDALEALMRVPTTDMPQADSGPFHD